MKILIDTHCLLWWLSDPKRLNSRARKLISNPRTNLYFSVASTWEIALKYKKGKLNLPLPVEEFFIDVLEDLNINLLSIKLDHVLQSTRLKQHHQDPFDRILISQTILENLLLLTADKTISLYDCDIIWAK